MTSENYRLKFVLIGFAVWSLLSLEGGEGTDIGGDETRYRRRIDNNEGYHADSDVSTCKCISQSSILTCKTPTPGCDEDVEVHHNGSCYRFVTQRESLDDSVRDCIQHNSHLVYIETSEEQTFLAEMLSKDTDYWFGLVAVNVTYFWMNGSTSVAQGLFPVDEEGGGKCVFIKTRTNRNVEIKTDDCSEEKQFICERTGTECVPWYGGSCYKVYEDSHVEETRDEAFAKCIMWRGHLLYIETSGELNYGRNHIFNHEDYWIGLNVTRTYQWMDGTPALFDRFESTNGDNGNECFRMRSQNNFEWNDRECNGRYGYICERRIMESDIPQVAEGDWCQSSIPTDLIRLGKYGALCFDTDDSSSTPPLRGCATHDGVEGCSCYRDTNGQIQCSCGFCKLNSTGNGQVWPSEFNCSCSSSKDETDLFTIIKKNGTEFKCSPDGPLSTTQVSHLTTSMPSFPSTLLPPTTGQLIGNPGTSPAVTTSASKETSTNKNITATSTGLVSSSTAAENGTAAGVTSYGGAVAGAILAFVFFVGLLVVAFFVWRRKGRKRSERSNESRTAKNPGASGQPETDNPTYGLDELDISKQSDQILKPVHGVGVHAVRNPTYDVGDERETSNDYTYIKSPDDKRKGNSSYTDIQPRGYEAYRQNHQPDPYTALGTKGDNEDDDPATYTPVPNNAGESYATIASSGYTAYNSNKQDDDVYTDPLSTRDTDDDDPLVYTPIPNNDRGKPAKKVVDDVDNDYVGLDDLVPQRPAAVAATSTPSAPGRNGDSDYVDFDAKEPSVLKESGNYNGKVDATTTSKGNYVSMDAPTSQGEKGDDNASEEGDYYFKLENSIVPPDEDTEAPNAPKDDHTYSSLGVNARNVAPDHSMADVPDNNTYNTVDRTPKRRAEPKNGGRSPAQGNIHGKGNVKDNSEYDVINRALGGGKYPIIAADDGDYSLTVPPRDDTYNSFDRSHGRNEKSRPRDQTSQNDYGSLGNNDDGEYATFD